MSFSQFLSIVNARRWLALAVLLVVVLMTLLVSLWMPSRYTATATVLFEMKADPVSGQAQGGSTAYMATQVDIIESPIVAQRVARMLKLDTNVQFQELWRKETGGRGDFYDWLGRWIKPGLNVQPSRQSNVIEVSYSFNDPRFATTAANAFVRAYIDTALELRVEPAKQYSGFFDDRIKAARDRLESAQQRLTAFQKTNSIVATDERVDVETARMDQLSSQLVSMKAATSDSAQRAYQAAQNADRSLDVMNNSVVTGLKSEVVRLEATLQQINARLGEAHPQVVELKANLAGLRVKLAEEMRRVTSSIEVNRSINAAREADIRAEFDAQKARVLKIKALRDEMQVLQQDVVNAQRVYDALQARLSQTSLESQNTQTNVAVLNPAAEPYEPSSPKVMLNTVVAFAGGLMLAIGCVMLLEMADRRVRSAEDVAQELQVPVLGYMPRPSTVRRLKSKRQSWLEKHVLPQLPAPGLKRT